ncbi:hypothetical protein [Roseateles amylovorans]|uniref:Uncharacterized protein n=1 Tax=Roseateles amylovorans TaxID=2978473 RepID=A0ABY6B5J4_9BURK|nr:hypothetical protein [Roseateles amylovorans]UXH78798.1 hypothetical protein N4261_02335 [Roseateles amylovorans]
MKRVALALLMAAGASAHAQSEADLLRCLNIAEDGPRLACFDQAARALKDARSASRATAPAAAAVGTAPTAAAPAAPSADNFGQPARAAAAPTELKSTLTRDFSGWNRNDRVTLANGQIWQLLDEGTVIAPLKQPQVVIKPGFMSGFFMSIDGLSFPIRVKRIQ